MMKQKNLRAAAAMVAAVLFLSTGVSAAPSVSAHSAILVDAASGRVLFEKNADEKSLIASTTKIMTGLLAAETMDLTREFTIPPEAVGIEGSSLYLKEGEVLTIEQLLYGLMLRSGNDAAVALAIAAAGSEEAFAEQMNTRAQELGLRETHFANPHGLDNEGNYSTARDLASLARAAMENRVFARVVSTKNYQFGQRSVTNHNKLLWRYEGACGIKTGYTKAAGRLLVSAAEREGRMLIAVTINAPNDWSDHASMLDFGFQSYAQQEFAAQGECVGAVPVVGGTAVLAQCEAAEDLQYPMLAEEDAELRICLPRFVFAPIAKGARAGALQVLVDGKVAGQVDLVWTESVDQLQEKSGNWLLKLFGG